MTAAAYSGHVPRGSPEKIWSLTDGVTSAAAVRPRIHPANMRRELIWLCLGVCILLCRERDRRDMTPHDHDEGGERTIFISREHLPTSTAAADPMAQLPGRARRDHAGQAPGDRRRADHDRPRRAADARLRRPRRVEAARARVARQRRGDGRGSQSTNGTFVDERAHHRLGDAEGRRQDPAGRAAASSTSAAAGPT